MGEKAVKRICTQHKNHICKNADYKIINMTSGYSFHDCVSP